MSAERQSMGLGELTAAKVLLIVHSPANKALVPLRRRTTLVGASDWVVLGSLSWFPLAHANTIKINTQTNVASMLFLILYRPWAAVLSISLPHAAGPRTGPGIDKSK